MRDLPAGKTEVCIVGYFLSGEEVFQCATELFFLERMIQRSRLVSIKRKEQSDYAILWRQKEKFHSRILLLGIKQKKP